ncbi:cyclophilin family peptidyl-prolyl cis-trans isomerase [Neobacillus niacini]|uniref:hypothetical protein n=1 Tax=Neobacillus niacini TaxID=86668 RepID=UPI00286565AE|nr:hypothetical protein [Neobacillus niacini]MDR7077112.1 cyclophilin family peptidyl-prolyl cis-trans isomerase [Neobacillus niacini]
MQDSTIATNIRRKEIIRLAANQALELPILPSGYWFHQDLRDNFYYAIHLFAYCVDKEFECNWKDEQCEKAKGIALTMINNVLALQDVNPDDPMYGHWPLNLRDNPQEAKPNLLPVELMGCLLILFYNKYQNELSPTVKNNCYQAITHIYESNVYRHPLKNMHHHEAKHTSLKLLLGDFFNNDELLQQGLQLAQKQLNHIRTFGFKEYGAHPWFWHWVQSLTCVWETVENTDVKRTMSDLLDYLWRLRADYYLEGTWVGPHSRQLRHDSPKDRNTLLDYIQFGDFSVPKEIVRLEGTALFTYEVSDDIVQSAIHRSQHVEVKRKIQFAYADDIVTEEAHTYVFITPDYAVGGIWERIREFDNEQKRWDITLPFTQSESANQAFFFHPGEKYLPGDDRHASSFGEVMFHMDTVIQIWNVPTGDKEAFPAIIGCLPKGEWKFEKDSGYGKVGDTFITFQLINEFNWEEQKDRISISSPLASNWNGVIMEIVSSKEAVDLGIIDLESFSMAMKEKNHSCFTSEGSIEKMTASYVTCRNESVQFSLDHKGNVNRLLNGHILSLDDYPII